ncbi:MAG: dipicolinate synthase subunit B [Firmicutes bacterium]|nr:dipicolinate synthase subunit B [Bacillota bacterium]
MELNGKRIGFGITGSYCTFAVVFPEIRRLIDAGAVVSPIMSEAAASVDTRFGKAKDFINEIEQMCGQRLITTIAEAEPIGPRRLLDLLIIAPCTGNTLAKMANGITDTSILMAAKAQLRNERPVLVAVSTNDGLSNNAANIGLLLNRRHVYMVPFGQDDPDGKSRSLVADMTLVLPAAAMALEGKQIQPLLIQFKLVSDNRSSE